MHLMFTVLRIYELATNCNAVWKSWLLRMYICWNVISILYIKIMYLYIHYSVAQNLLGEMLTNLTIYHPKFSPATVRVPG